MELTSNDYLEAYTFIGFTIATVAGLLCAFIYATNKRNET